MKRGRDLYYQVLPLIIVLTKLLRLLPRQLRYVWLAIFRGTPGLIGVGLRYVALRSLAKNCGDNVYIGPYVFLSYLENCSIGSNVSIREMCTVGCRGGVQIGSNVSIAHGSSVLSTEHQHQVVDMRNASGILKPVTIGDGVWVGAGVRVTAGVAIGEGAVVGTGAVVTKSIPEYSIAVGVPARVIGTRSLHKD